MRWFGRLARRGDIGATRRHGRRVSGVAATAYGLPRPQPPTTVAIVTSKALGNAVVRNRIRRRLRGALETLAEGPRPLRLLLVARREAATLPFGALVDDVGALLARLAG